jgi:hypothetical protein
MAKDKSGYSVSNAEFAAWKNGKKGARPSAAGGLDGSGCLVAMAALPLLVLWHALETPRKRLRASMCLECRIGNHKRCWRGDCPCCHGRK